MALHLLKKLSSLFLKIGALFFVVSCKQENILFYPEKLPEDYKFGFPEKHEELFFEVEKNIKLNGLLFTSDSSKGLIFYLHGNAGALNSWGEIANLYLANQYDFFILDYRGYGKSNGSISSETQFHNDLQIVYDSLKTKYTEKKIVIIGYSIGTGPAAKLASTNNPKLLILKAPYYNIPELAKKYVGFAPSALIKYTFKTNEFISNVKCPITIFHGDQDEVIPVESTYKLKAHLKPTDQVIILKGQSHNGVNENPTYQKELGSLLKS